MTIYLGRNKPLLYETEGIGSTIQWDLLLKYIANALEVNHHAIKFENISHYQYTKYSKNEWNNLINNFFNFDNISNYENNYEIIHSEDLDPRILNILQTNRNSNKNYLLLINNEKSIQDFCDVAKNFIFSEENIKNVRKSLNYIGKKHFREGINVAYHLRNTNQKDVDFIDVREYFNIPQNQYLYHERFKNIVTFLNNSFINKKINIHIYSQGNIEEFKYFMDYENKNIKIYLHLNEDPTSDIYHMAYADILFMANSSFSYLASLLNPNLVFIRDNWWQLKVPNSILINNNYSNIAEINNK